MSKNSQYRKRQKGFTLIELLLAMALLSVLLLVMTDILISVMDVKTSSEAVSAVDEDAKFIMARLSYDVRRADSISNPAALGATGSSLQMTAGGSAYSYTLAGGNLQLTDGSGTNNLNSSETTVSDISFQKNRQRRRKRDDKNKYDSDERCDTKRQRERNKNYQ